MATYVLLHVEVEWECKEELSFGRAPGRPGHIGFVVSGTGKCVITVCDEK